MENITKKLAIGKNNMDNYWFLKSRKHDEEDDSVFREGDIAYGYSRCPQCGGRTISCVVADDVCQNDGCGYVGQYYENTIYN